MLSQKEKRRKKERRKEERKRGERKEGRERGGGGRKKEGTGLRVKVLPANSDLRSLPRTHKVEREK